MYNLQKALDERLAMLKNRKYVSKQSVRAADTSRDYIERSLKQAGILDQNGKLIDKVKAI